MIYSPEEFRDRIIPYLNRRLSEKERQEFDETLKRDPERAKEFREFSEIKELYEEIEEEIHIPSSFLYQRILSHIQSGAKGASAIKRIGYPQKIKEFLKPIFLSPRLSWGLALAQFVLILILLVTLMGRDGFRTLTKPPVSSKDIAKINVVFNKESKEKEIREVLQRIGANIISGPSEEGLYIIEIKNHKNIESILKALRETSIVSLAERAY